MLVGLSRSVDPNGQTGGHTGLASDPWVPLRNIPALELARLWGARGGGYGQALLPGPVAVNAQLGGRRELSASKPPLFLQTIWPAWLGLTQPLVLSVSLGLPWLRAWWELEPWQLSLQATGWTVS